MGCVCRAGATGNGRGGAADRGGSWRMGRAAGGKASADLDPALSASARGGGEGWGTDGTAVSGGEAPADGGGVYSAGASSGRRGPNRLLRGARGYRRVSQEGVEVPHAPDVFLSLIHISEP